MKKILSIILAVITLMSALTVPAFAANSLPFTDEDYLREGFSSADYKQYYVGSKNNKAVEWPEGTLVPDSSYYSENGSRGNNSYYDKNATDIQLPKSTVIISHLLLNGRKSVETINFSELTDLKFIDCNSVGYTKISELDLSNTQVVKIGHGAFSSSYSLKKIVTPQTLKVIDYNAFEACARISDVTLNDGLERIESEAFCNYTPFQLYLPSSLVYIADDAFRGYGKQGSYKVVKGSYAEEWCKSGDRKYTYVDGSSGTTPAAPSTPPNTPPTPSTTTPAPTMEHTQKIGGVTFSNVVKYEEIDTIDFNNNKIHAYYVTLGSEACMRSDVDNTDFIYYDVQWNSPGPLGTDKDHFDGVYNKTLSNVNVVPYPTTKNANGTWSAGLTWQVFDKYNEDTLRSKFITVKQGDKTYNYLLQVEQYPVYTDQKPTIDTTTQAESATANPNMSKVIVDGKVISFDSYNINNNNFFKLRDIAQVLKGTSKQFEVKWDDTISWMDGYGNWGKGAIVLTSKTPYTTVGGELKAGDGTVKQSTLNHSPIYLDSAYNQVKMAAYTINGNNYFKLRDLGFYFDFDVAWDANQNAVVVDTQHSYNPNT